MTDQNTIYCDGKFGDDNHAGLSWAQSVRTIAHAHSIAEPGMTILLGQMEPNEGQPDVTVTKPVTIQGTGNALYARNPIQPASATSTVIKVAGGDVQLRNLCIDTRRYHDFTGIGIDCEHADGIILDVFNYYGYADADSNKVYGGTGLRWQHGEQASLTHLHISDAQRALDLQQEGSCNQLRHVRTNQCYQDLVMEGAVGGWLVEGWKAVNSGSPDEVTDVVSLGPLSGDNTFVNVDWAEAGANAVRDQGHRNVYVRPIFAPNTTWHLEGDHTTLIAPKVLGAPPVFSGCDIRIVGPSPN